MSTCVSNSKHYYMCCDFWESVFVFSSGPYSLNGYRVRVYRQDSATQWFTGIITHHDLFSRTMVVMNDQVQRSSFDHRLWLCFIVKYSSVCEPQPYGDCCVCFLGTRASERWPLYGTDDLSRWCGTFITKRREHRYHVSTQVSLQSEQQHCPCEWMCMSCRLTVCVSVFLDQRLVCVCVCVSRARVCSVCVQCRWTSVSVASFQVKFLCAFYFESYLKNPRAL